MSLAPRKPLLAVLANLGAPGLGQLYSGSWRRAVIIYMIALSAFPIASLTRLTYIFSTMVILVILTLAFFIWMSVDASSLARRSPNNERKVWNRWYFYIGLVLLHLIVVVPTMEFLFPRPTKSFRVPASSMMPTLHIGDHIMADMTAYERAKARRGGHHHL